LDSGLLPYSGPVAPETFVAAFCLTLSVGFVWPQVARVYRMDTVEGLSPRGTLHGIAGSVLWVAYGLFRTELPLILGNANILLAMLLIGLAQARHKVLDARAIAAVLAITTAVAVGTGALSVALTGWLAIIVGATSIIPQTLHVVRSEDLSGVSLVMYSLIVINGVAWSIYGLLVSDLLIVIPGFVVIPCAGFIAARTMKFRARVETEAALAC